MVVEASHIGSAALRFYKYYIVKLNYIGGTKISREINKELQCFTKVAIYW
jgi:hypothetical protein